MNDLKTLTIVKTDMKGFTSRSSTLAAREMADVLARHRKLIAGIAGRTGGRIFKELGDSYLIAYDSATTAVQAALEIQRDLSFDQVGERDDDRIEVRVAVATGDVFDQGGDYFGDAVNLTARLETITPAAEVYLAESTRLAANRAEIAMDFVDEFRFKNVAEPIRVYRCRYRHATREVNDVVVVFTDILGFTNYTANHTRAQVETMIDYYDETLRAVANEFGGVIRLVNGDVYLMTFEDCDRAINGLRQMIERMTCWNDQHPGERPIDVVAGVDYGNLNIYRTAVFGEAGNKADFAREVASDLKTRSTLVTTGGVRDKLSDRHRDRLLEVDPAQMNLKVRMTNRGIDSLWCYQ
ncbi:MAG: adenylate/guanylate cyclase domain-containing protein [Pirellulales bacterium]